MVLGAVPTLVENSFLQVDIRWDMTLLDLFYWPRKTSTSPRVFPVNPCFWGFPLWFWAAMQAEKKKQATGCSAAMHIEAPVEDRNRAFGRTVGCCKCHLYSVQLSRVGLDMVRRYSHVGYCRIIYIRGWLCLSE